MKHLTGCFPALIKFKRYSNHHHSKKSITIAPAFPRQIVPDPLNVHRGPQPADDIDHKNEQQEDLCRVIEKEFDGITQWRSLADRKKIIGQPLRKRHNDGIDRPPQRKGRNADSETACSVHL